MQKDFTRDYVTAAFRFYAQCGQPTYEQAREIIYQAEIEKRSEIDPALAVAQAEAVVAKQTPALLDLLAVGETIALLERGGKPHIMAAVRAVYLANPSEEFRRGDIIGRVRRFALEYPADERSVYRWLKEARLLCAAIRGLRITDSDMMKYEIAR